MLAQPRCVNTTKKRENIKLACILSENGYEMSMHTAFNFFIDLKFETRRVISQGVDALWKADLADVSYLAKHNNDGTKYLLVAIDVFSRYLWIEPLKNKLYESIIKTQQYIFILGRIPEELWTEKGSEWKNKWVAAFLKTNNVHREY